MAKKKGQKGGGMPKPYLSSALGRPPVEVQKLNGSEYKLTATLELDHDQPRFPVATDVQFQGKSVGVVKVHDPRKTSFTVKPDLDLPLKLSVRPLGWNNPSHELELDHELFKKAGKRPKQGDLSISVEVGPLSVSKEQVVVVHTKDPDTNSPCSGTVQITPGQRYKANGQEGSGSLTLTTNDQGLGNTCIQLLEADTTVPFLHIETGHVVHKSLLKEA